jgi:hypothetical protein
MKDDATALPPSEDEMLTGVEVCSRLYQRLVYLQVPSISSSLCALLIHHRLTTISLVSENRRYHFSPSGRKQT